MEVKFWKHGIELFGYLSFILIVLLGDILCIIFVLLNEISTLSIVIFSAILLFLLLIVFFNKNVLSKVIISEIGIKLMWFKKEILFINWEDIIEVKSAVQSFCTNYLTFVTKDNTIRFDLTKKMYDTIMAVCPIPNIKVRINELDAFKFLHKNDNNQNTY